MKPLLLLVDLQRDFLSAAALAPAAERVVDQAASLLGHCRERGIAVSHVWTTVSREPDNRMAHWKQQGLWRCLEGTPGHESPPELAPVVGETIIHKNGFSAFANGRLAETIRAGAIDTLVVAGVHLHACVRQAVVDALQEGLRVWVAEDAVGSDDLVHAAITRRYLEARSVRFLSVDALVDDLSNVEEDGVLDCPDPAPATEAVDHAVAFAGNWRKEPVETRIRLIQLLATHLAERQGELSELMARELGKPVRFGKVEAQRTVEMLHDIGRCAQMPGEAESVGPALVRRQPHGVVAVVTPWNNPLYIALGKIVPAMLHGNTVVWKPAPEAGRVSRWLMGLIEASGWPSGLVRMVEGGRCEAVVLMSDQRVDAVTLTGSCAAGYAAQELCARRRIPLQAELGGNNAAIVWPDADLTEAGRCVAAGAFEMAGQRCTANRRVIVHEHCRAEFIKRLITFTAELKWGDPLNDETDIGPLVGERQRDGVARMVERTETACGPAVVPHGTAQPAGKRSWYAPTILRCDDPGSEIVQEETFGPVLIVQTAADWEQAIGLCNSVRQGLVASIFTRSAELAHRFIDEAAAGILKVNESTADAAVGVPFGGWKNSGLGPAEHGECDREFYTHIQTIYGHPGPLIS